MLVVKINIFAAILILQAFSKVESTEITRKVIRVTNLEQFCTNVDRRSNECMRMVQEYIEKRLTESQLTAQVSLQDLDECSFEEGSSHSHDCHEHAKCVNVLTYFQCQCNEGYTDNTPNTPGKNCTDTNECEVSFPCHRPTQTCNNLPGSYSCTCKAGFDEDSANHACKDINECSDSPCPNNSQCFNNDGSYGCFCNAGLVFNEATNTCNVVDLCISEEVSCQDGYQCLSSECICPVEETCGPITCSTLTCQSTNSECADDSPAPACVCKEGYQRDGTGGCVDVDECILQLYNCPANSNCVNDEASYFCICYDGFVMNDTIGECEDENECLTFDCGENFSCLNFPGTFLCVCNSGYYRSSDNPNICTNIDECTAGVHDCNKSTSVCRDVAGGFVCDCRSGFIGNGLEDEVNSITRTNCVDVNECDENTHSCHTNAMCNNTIGGYTCECLPRYQGDGQECTEIDVGSCPTPGYDRSDHSCNSNDDCLLNEVCCSNDSGNSCLDPSVYTTTVICENQDSVISCSGSAVLTILTDAVIYGRRDSETCPHPLDSNQNCGIYGENNNDILEAVCNNQNQCTVSASNSIYGDPCAGTYKYLKFTFKCE